MTAPASGDDALRKWLRKLTAAPLPVFPETARRMRAVIAEGGESMRTLARVAASDPAFAFHVFREANALAGGSSRVFYDLEHTMSVLGMQRVLALIGNLPVLQDSAQDQAAYRRQLAISHHAGTLTQAWLEARKRPAPQEARWTAALRTAPLWAIAHADPKAMGTIERVLAGPRASLRVRLRRMFGCGFRDLTLALFAHWKLTGFMQPLLGHESACDNRLLVALARLGDIPRERRAGTAFPHRVLLNENMTFAVVANSLALHAGVHWYSRGTLRMERAAAGLLNLSAPAAVRSIHAQAAQAARTLGGHAGGAPAAGLLDPQPHLHRHAVARQRPQSPAPVAASPSAPRLRGSASVLGQAVGALRDHGGAAAGLPGILRALLTGLHRGLGLPRVLVLTRNREDRIQLRLQAGLDESLHRAVLATDYGTGRNVFVQLASQAGFACAAGERRQTLLAALPAGFREALRPGAFMLGSLRFQGRPAILVYADCGAGVASLEPAVYGQYKKLCQEAALALQRLEVGK